MTMRCPNDGNEIVVSIDYVTHDTVVFLLTCSRCRRKVKQTCGPGKMKTDIVCAGENLVESNKRWGRMMLKPE